MAEQWLQRREIMMITYLNGKTVQAVLLARDGDSVTVAIDGADDAMAFSRINGAWVSDDCEPVHIEFAWERRAEDQPVSAEDCCCSHELAARLIHLLYTDSAVDEEAGAVPFDAAGRLAAGANH
jgi:hypothetical protein